MEFATEVKEKYNLFCDLEIPPLFRKLASRGQGFLRVRCGRYSYLVRYTEEGMPEIVGRFVEKFRKIGDKYTAAYLPAEYFPAQERTTLEALLV